VRLHPGRSNPPSKPRYRLAEIYTESKGPYAAAPSLVARVVEAEQKSGNERTDRTRYLGR